MNYLLYMKYIMTYILGFVFCSLAYAQGTWSNLTSIPAHYIGVEGASVAVIGNKIIVANGHDGADTATTRIYDISHDTWSYGSDAPGASSEGVGVSHGGLFYQIGGRGFGPRNDIWSYDLESDQWNATLTPMLVERTAPAAAVVGNAIYVIGGRMYTGGPCSGRPLASVERYDIDTDTWTTVASLPFARSDAAAAAIGGKIYLFGGCDEYYNFLTDVDVYDPVTDSWSSAPSDMPFPGRAAMYAISTKGNEIFVIGGWDGIGFGLDLNQSYKVSKDSWTTHTPMPTPRAEAGAVGHGGRIYIVGGAQPGFGASVVNNEVFKP
jgi:N-acetylneuraminic acid mutarotase